MGRSLALLAALIFCAAELKAQIPGDPDFARCLALPSEQLSTFESDKKRLEAEVAHRLEVIEAQTKPELRAKLEQELRETQKALLEVIFNLDCLNNVGPHSRRGRKQTSGETEGSLEVTAYFATNRKVSQSPSFYGPQSDTVLRYGRVIVTIPPTHAPGKVELPTLWKLERTADPSKHFTLKAVVPLEGDAARRELAEKFASMNTKALLLFVHGYNTTFADAALRTAQLAHDLRFPGLAFFYSWPSAGTVAGYWKDEEVSQLAEGVFEELVDNLSRLSTDIYVVAHSMGNRIVTNALRSRLAKGADTSNLRELLLAAPDINVDIFRNLIAPKLAEMRGTHTTLYASSFDLALEASRVVHGFKRVGETRGDIFTYPGLDTIDASGAAPVARAYGHSYLMDSSRVLKDIQAIVDQKLEAKQRGLGRGGAAPNEYWLLR